MWIRADELVNFIFVDLSGILVFKWQSMCESAIGHLASKHAKRLPSLVYCGQVVNCFAVKARIVRIVKFS